MCGNLTLECYHDAHGLESVALENLWRQRVDQARYQSALQTARLTFRFLNDDVVSLIAAAMAAPARTRILSAHTA